MIVYLISGGIGSGKSFAAKSITNSGSCQFRKDFGLEFYTSDQGDLAITANGNVDSERFLKVKEHLSNICYQPTFIELRTANQNPYDGK